MKDVSTNLFLDPGEGAETQAERPSDALGNALWDSFETVSGREMGKSFPGVMENTEDDAPDGLYGRVKKSRLTGPLADSFTQAIDSNRAAPGETGYGMHNLSNEFVVRLMYPHSTPLGNETARALFEQSPPAYSYLTGRKSPPKPWGTYVGAKYDEEAGRRATAEGRDLGALESQVQTAFYRPDRDRSGNNPYRTMEYRTERDGGGAGLVKLNANAESGDGGDSGDVTGMLDLIRSPDPAPTEGTLPGSGEAMGPAGEKMMDYMNRYDLQNLDSLDGAQAESGDDSGNSSQKLIDSWAQQSPKELGYGGVLPEEGRDLKDRMDTESRLNRIKDRFDEERVVRMGKHTMPWNDVYKQLDKSPTGNIYEFNADNGEFYKDGKLLWKGYSGKGDGKNNVEMMDVKNVGPTPYGVYTVTDRKSKRGNQNYLVLEEAKPEIMGKIGRESGTFRAHGDNTEKPGTASTGCIILDPITRYNIPIGSVIVVKNSKW